MIIAIEILQITYDGTKASDRYVDFSIWYDNTNSPTMTFEPGDCKCGPGKSAFYAGSYCNMVNNILYYIAYP